MNRKIGAVGLLLLWVTPAAFAASDAEKKEPFYYRTALAATARANAAKYGWAGEMYGKITGDARRWLGWSDERILHYVPEVTPMRLSST